jgi:hypothetical protein
VPQGLCAPKAFERVDEAPLRHELGAASELDLGPSAFGASKRVCVTP